MEPFLHRDAAARGHSPATVRESMFAHPVDGVAMAAHLSDDLDSRCRAVGLVLTDDSVFTHLTSAELRGWWLPSVGMPLLIACSDADGDHRELRGVYVRRCAIPAVHREVLDGVRVASAAWTIIELAEHLSLLDLVVVIDGALAAGDVTVRDIRATMVRGRRGVRVLRRALELADGRSESAWETVLRLLHLLSGVPVEPQVTMVNRAGVPYARADLRIRGTRRLVEYDGAGHRDRAQHQSDLRREKQLARDGWERFGYVASEILRDPGRVLADADTALGREHRPDRLDVWRREVAASSLHPVGAAALRRRLLRFVRSEARRRPPRDRRVG